MYLTYDHCQNHTDTNGKILRETTQGNNIRGNILVIERSINYDYRYPMEKKRHVEYHLFLIEY